LEEQGSGRWNGSVLTAKMWNRSFVGWLFRKLENIKKSHFIAQYWKVVKKLKHKLA
jgi:hypothetical protein